MDFPSFLDFLLAWSEKKARRRPHPPPRPTRPSACSSAPPSAPCDDEKSAIAATVAAAPCFNHLHLPLPRRQRLLLPHRPRGAPPSLSPGCPVRYVRAPPPPRRARLTRVCPAPPRPSVRPGHRCACSSRRCPTSGSPSASTPSASTTSSTRSSTWRAPAPPRSTPRHTPSSPRVTLRRCTPGLRALRAGRLRRGPAQVKPERPDRITLKDLLRSGVRRPPAARKPQRGERPCVQRCIAALEVRNGPRRGAAAGRGDGAFHPGGRALVLPGAGSPHASLLFVVVFPCFCWQRVARPHARSPVLLTSARPPLRSMTTGRRSRPRRSRRPPRGPRGRLGVTQGAAGACCQRTMTSSRSECAPPPAGGTPATRRQVLRISALVLGAWMRWRRSPASLLVPAGPSAARTQTAGTALLLLLLLLS